jgi:PAS domain S-box-containing protein
MIDVILISTVWGFGLSAITSVVSAIAYAYFRTWPNAHFGPTELSFWLSIAVFLFVALLANTIAAVARTGERFSDLSSDLLAIVGPQRFIRVNRACERILGYSEDEMTSQPWMNLVAPQDRDRVRSIFGTLADSTEPVLLETQMICKDRSRRWVEWNMVWHGDLAYAIGRDVTERRREQDKLRETQAMLEVSRDKSRVLAEQQAALRRMATLVARSVSPSAVFEAVAQEMVHCFDTDGAGVFRYEADGSAIVLASSSKPGSQYLPVGEHLMFDGDNMLAWIRETGRVARHDDIADARGPVIARLREIGIRSGVGAPIVVDGRVWGAAIVASSQRELLPPNTEERVSDFAELIATAIANAATRAELLASRARIVTATDNARRRIERDLHDGAQQRLVSLALHLRMMREDGVQEAGELRMELDRAIIEASDALEELRELSRGIHPVILSDGGLAPALKTLARRSPVPVSLDVAIEQRLPDSVEVAAYYVVAEALTNVAKHAGASEVSVRAQTQHGELRLFIEDNGIGGAQCGTGSGLIGLFDRVEALGGNLRIVSPGGMGTSLEATFPIAIA